MTHFYALCFLVSFFSVLVPRHTNAWSFLLVGNYYVRSLTLEEVWNVSHTCNLFFILSVPILFDLYSCSSILVASLTQLSFAGVRFYMPIILLSSVIAVNTALLLSKTFWWGLLDSWALKNLRCVFSFVTYTLKSILLYSAWPESGILNSELIALFEGYRNCLGSSWVNIAVHQMLATPKIYFYY